MGVVLGLFCILEFWYFVFRKGKKNETIPENVDRLYASVDYSGVYELPTITETPKPPPVPDRNKYGVQVNTII